MLYTRGLNNHWKKLGFNLGPLVLQATTLNTGQWPLRQQSLVELGTKNFHGALDSCELFF